MQKKKQQFVSEMTLWISDQSYDRIEGKLTDFYQCMVSIRFRSSGREFEGKKCFLDAKNRSEMLFPDQLSGFSKKQVTGLGYTWTESST